MCDNTDCQTPNAPILTVRLKKEFGLSECEWCTHCIDRDQDMINDTEDLYKYKEAYNETIKSIGLLLDDWLKYPAENITFKMSEELAEIYSRAKDRKPKNLNT